MLLFIFAAKSWEIYLLGSAVVLLSIAVCVLMLYIIIKKTNKIERAKCKVLETEGDKARTMPLATLLEQTNLKIKKLSTGGFEVIDKETKEQLGFADTQEEAEEILTQLAKTQKPEIEVQNRKGEDGEMVSYVNDKNMQL